MIKFTDIADMKYNEQIKHFNKVDKNSLINFVYTKGKSVDKKLHPIILFNYPELITGLIKRNEIDSSISAMDKIANGELEYQLTQEQKVYYKLIKSIFNKEYDDKDIIKVIEDNELSNRRVGVIAKVYPSLYKNSMPSDNNYIYSKILMAIEFKNKDFLLKNINFIINNIHDSKIAVVKEFLPEVFNYLNPNQYTDDDVLKYINSNKEMVQYIKEDINKIKYWDTWKSTEFTYINSEYLLNYAIENDYEIHDLCIKIAEKFSSRIIEKYAYYFDLFNREISHLCTKEFNLKALKDPYNLMHLDYNDEDYQLEFIKQSNNNLYDAMYVLNELDIDLSYMINKFSDIHTAITTYPVLTKYVDKKHITPYVCNLMVNIDQRMFEYI